MQLFNAALADLEAAGAILVHIDKRPATPADYGTFAYDLLKFEFKDGVNAYLASTSPDKVKTRSLEELMCWFMAMPTSKSRWEDLSHNI